MSDATTDKEVPLFMNPEDEVEMTPLPELKLPDYEKPLSARYKILAMMLAMGKPNKEISEKLGLCGSRLSVLKSNPAIQREVERIQDRLYEKTLDERMKDLGPEAMNVIEDAITNETLELKDRVMQARWLVEKLTGKPAQQVDHKGELSIGIFMDKLDSIKSSGKTLEEAIDVTPKLTEDTTEAPLDNVDKWIRENL